MAAKMIKATAIGSRYFKKLSFGLSRLKKYTINANTDIKIVAGKIQTANVKKASIGPPILNPMAVMVWVHVGPGNILHKEVSSFNSSSVR